MSANSRMSAMEAFEKDGTHTMEEPKFVLCSLMACGVGVNLTRGNVVFLMDPW
jgi:SNF2 family DNA or RNA helicase